ncbi:MAG: hypothetical protein Fur009_5260 [Candidatus Microgenomates bacterium]
MDNQNLIHKLDKNELSTDISYKVFFSFVAVAVILGTLFGFLTVKLTKKSSSLSSSSSQKSIKTIGIADKKTFKDQAEGILKEGGIDGEGNFHLERPGGESQNVYLTSTTVDLSQYIGKKVRVWGQTFSSEKAGWLMDVGLVEIIK